MYMGHERVKTFQDSRRGILPGSMSERVAASPTTDPIVIFLDIEGMTCASCVNRIERYLTRTDGVTDAHVNLATERATVTVDPALVGRTELEHAVAAAGYDVRPAEPSDPSSLGTELGMGEAAVAQGAGAARPRHPGARLDRPRGRDDGRHALAGGHRRPDDDAELGPARAGHVRPDLGRRRLHPLGGAPGPPSIGEHGHARRGRDARGLGLQRRGHGRAGARHGCRHRAGHLLRLGRDDRRAHPCGSLARGADARTGGRRDGEPRRAAATDRARHPRRRPSRTCRSRMCVRATCCGSDPARRCPWTASSSTARRWSTSRC